MVTVTEKAAKYIHNKLENAGIKFPPGGIRFGIRAGGCSGFQYYYKLEKKDDYWDFIILCHRIRIFVDRKSMTIMRDTVIDISNNIVEEFIFNNPNAKTSCGCGTSFEIR